MVSMGPYKANFFYRTVLALTSKMFWQKSIVKVHREHWNFQTYTTKREKNTVPSQVPCSEWENELFNMPKQENPYPPRDHNIHKNNCFVYTSANLVPCDIETCTCNKHVNFRKAIQTFLKDLRANEKSMKVENQSFLHLNWTFEIFMWIKEMCWMESGPRSLKGLSYEWER